MMSAPLTKDTMIPGNDDYDPYFDEEKDPQRKTKIVNDIEKVAGKHCVEILQMTRAIWTISVLPNYYTSLFSLFFFLLYLRQSLGKETRGADVLR